MSAAKITGTMTIDGVEYEFTARAKGGKGAAERVARPQATGNLPALPDEYQTMVVTPCKFWTRDGVSKPSVGRDGKERPGRPWTVFVFRDMDDEDLSFATFDVELGALAEKLCKEGKRVRVAYTQGERGFKFVGLPASVDEAEPEEEMPPAQEAAEVEQPQPEDRGRADDDNLPF